jgi:hypothetical protein
MFPKIAVTLVCLAALSACGPARRAELEKKPDDVILADLRGGGNERICKAGFINQNWYGPRTQEIARREAALRQLGDCSEEHKKCLNFGFALGTPGYSECRMRMEGVKVQAEAAKAASDAANAYSSQLLMQSLQPKSAPSMNCTSTAIGNIVNTNCF